MKFEKPITNMMKQREELLLNAFKQTYGYLTKAEICVIIGSDDERTARDVVAHLRKRYPIISTSDGRGYKLARKRSDLEEAEHALAELSSRIEELEKNMKPLYKFRDWAKFGGQNGR